MVKTDNFEKVFIDSPEDLNNWLAKNHQQTESVWLVTYKKVVADKYVSTQEVLDELLCYGWIDGIRRKLNEQQTMQLIAPRKTQHWAKTYKDRARKLEETGRMQEAGRKAIAVSKEKGLWNFMDDVDALIKPDDLKKALASHPGSADFFDAMGAASQRFTLRWIKLAKTEKTRIKRIEKAASLAGQGKKIPGI